MMSHNLPYLYFTLVYVKKIMIYFVQSCFITEKDVSDINATPCTYQLRMIYRSFSVNKSLPYSGVILSLAKSAKSKSS